MKFSIGLQVLLSFSGLISATIWQNDQVKITDYPDTRIDPSKYDFSTFPPSSKELSYKGRWDSKYISWWSAPGLKFGFTGETIAITFGPNTSPATLIAYRIDGQDWLFTNVTANATHLLVTSDTLGVNLTTPINPATFEFRVTNWGYGVQISSIQLAKGSSLIKVPDYNRRIEVIGDSLSSGYTNSLESLSSYAYLLSSGLGNTEYSITAYPGICLVDAPCWGNERGMLYQFNYTSDTSSRATDIWGDKPEKWTFKKEEQPDLVFILLGTNDNNAHNNVTAETYTREYIQLIEGVHAKWPNAQIVMISIWIGFTPLNNTYEQVTLVDPSTYGFVKEIYSVYQHFNTPTYHSQPFVHYFNTTGIFQHNDISPSWHPTDVGHVKLASHLMQYVKQNFGWEFESVGPEVGSGTLYWNDEVGY